MKPRSEPEIMAWLAKANGDLIMARRAMAGELQLCDQACYHSQQAAEKVLKALLVASGKKAPRTHDLVALVHLLIPVHGSLSDLLEPAAELTKYSTAPRYPDFLAAETPDDAAKAIQQAEEFTNRFNLLLPE